MKHSKFFLFLILMGFIFLAPVLGQQKERMITLNVTQNPPLKIVVIKVNNKPIDFVDSRADFDENDDWLREFSIEVENITPFPIHYLGIELAISKDSNNMSKNAAESLIYGAPPPLPGQQTRVTSSQPPLQPGERVKLSVNYESLLRLLDSSGLKDGVKHVVVRTGPVVFPDGTMWDKGGIFRRHPQDPKRWVPCLRDLPGNIRC